MEKNLTCIVCPIGCNLDIQVDDNKVIKSIKGNKCKKGKSYAETELNHPKRMLTSTVLIENAEERRLPVITSDTIPKDKIFDVMQEIDKVKVCAPVSIDDIIVKNVCGLSVDILASRSIK